MKRLFEPITGTILSAISWAAWTDLLVSLLVAFLGGALAYLGKWICAKAVQHITHKKNVFVSKTRDEINSHNSPNKID
jgi:hypothetical protein